MPDNGGMDCIGETLEISQCSEVNCSGKNMRFSNNPIVFASTIEYRFPVCKNLGMNYILSYSTDIFHFQSMVNGHIGPVGPHVTSRVARVSNYGQEDVQIHYQRMVEKIVLEKV
jgi:hypothetical protein